MELAKERDEVCFRKQSRRDRTVGVWMMLL